MTFFTKWGMNLEGDAQERGSGGAVTANVSVKCRRRRLRASSEAGGLRTAQPHAAPGGRCSCRSAAWSAGPYHRPWLSRGQGTVATNSIFVGLANFRMFLAEIPASNFGRAANIAQPQSNSLSTYVELSIVYYINSKNLSGIPVRNSAKFFFSVNRVGPHSHVCGCHQSLPTNAIPFLPTTPADNISRADTSQLLCASAALR